MKFYKLSLGKKHFDEQDFTLLKKYHLVCVHPDTGKGEGPAFVGSNKGDLFYVCRSNDSIEFIGMFTDSRPLYSTIANKQDESWVDREYKILFDAKNKTNFDRDLNTKIMPRFQSTFTLITKNEYDLFEKEILQPVFNVSLDAVVEKRNAKLEKIKLKIEDYIAMQLHFKELMNEESVLFQKINALTNIELKKIEYTYKKRGDISNQPVVLLRSKILELLLEDIRIDASIIAKTKKELDGLFDTNVYHAWSSNFRILYTFLYDKDKSDLEFFFKKLISQFQKDLGIENETKVKLVHFDGAQNQGQDKLWFAIYNKVNSSQKLAKQLYFAIDNGLIYGLLNHGDLTKSELKQTETFDYQDVLNTFKLYKQNILSDNSMEKAKIAEYIDILEYKKQIILQGPPGTGKTYTAKDIAEQILTGDITHNKRKQAQVLKESKQFELVQFHPSYTYEDFVRGISAKSQGESISYETENKIIAKFSKLASNKKSLNTYNLALEYSNYLKEKTQETRVSQNHYYFNKEKTIRLLDVLPEDDNEIGRLRYEVLLNNDQWYMQTWLSIEDNYNLEKWQDPDTHKISSFNKSEHFAIWKDFDGFVRKLQINTHVLIIDEINRANLPSVLGELIYALEYRGESVNSMYAIDGDAAITIPENLYVIGTMNTADRSVGHIDYAIRRRFAFVELLPKELTSLGDRFKQEVFRQVSSLFVREIKTNGIDLVASEHLSPEFAERPQDIWLGHSYFIVQKDNEGNEIDFNLRLQYEIIPILEEYVKDGILRNSVEVKDIIQGLKHDF